MEQKGYKMEILLELLKGKNHVRSIAKSIGTNHMSISRKIKDLLNENVLDYAEEGKNKVFFLKKSTETRAYIFMAENYKLIRILGKYPTLRGIIEKIQKNNKIKLAILFGSYSKGLAKHDSDIDIYVETNDKKIKHEVELIDSRLSVKIGEFDADNLLVKEIIKNHVILKGVEDYYEKIKFFS